MNEKKFFLIYLIAGMLILGCAVAVIVYNHPAFAKTQQSNVKMHAKHMAKYSPSKKQHSVPNVRKSRLKQMNIVGEAATVLNVLPITIIDEMKKGKTLSQIVKAKGLTEKQFLQKLSSLETKTVNQAVSTGTISSKQKAAINAGKSDRLRKALQIKGVNVHDHAPMDMGN